MDNPEDDDCGLSDNEFDPYDVDININFSDFDKQDVAEKFNDDPEQIDVLCLKHHEVKEFIEDEINVVSEKLLISYQYARILLAHFRFDKEILLTVFKQDSLKVLNECNIGKGHDDIISNISFSQCTICYDEDATVTLTCNHAFCQKCIRKYIYYNMQNKCCLGINCLKCSILIEDKIILSSLISPDEICNYQQTMLSNLIDSHNYLTWCPGKNCDTIIRAETREPRQAKCRYCSIIFCFACRNEYHAPLPCNMFKDWMQKCNDDSETMNYICANTKDCPNCKVSIEKNGGCNHMYCRRCSYDFCWMCLGSWKAHAVEYYECSKYKTDPSLGSNISEARESLNKYLHYYSRWKNHEKSLEFEEDTLRLIHEHIDKQIAENVGTWIDWQYLLDAGNLLLKCRSTLKYTYAYAFFMEGPWKNIFENYQGQLEREIENLSWIIERAKMTDQAVIFKQMDITRQQRFTLLQEFCTKDLEKQYIS